jgi:hypothetical protein
LWSYLQSSIISYLFVPNILLSTQWWSSMR